MKPLTAAHSTLQASMKAALSSILLSDTDRSNASFSLVTSIKQNNNQNFPPMESLQVIYSIHEGIKYLHIYDETTSQLYSYDTSLNNTKVIDLSLISVKKEVNALKKEVSPRRKEAVKSEEMKF